MTSTVTIKVHVARTPHGCKRLVEGVAPPKIAPTPGTLPRVARLMALAIKLDGMIRSGVYANYDEIAQLGHVTTARVSQIMALANLAPGIQEELMFLPRTTAGRDPVTEPKMRHICKEIDWKSQRKLWADFRARYLDSRVMTT